MRAQSSMIDFLIGFVIFAIALVLFSDALSSQSQQDLSVDDPVRIASRLLSEGIPADWNATNYLRPGILVDGQVDADKWEALKSLASMQRDDLLITLDARSDFMMQLIYHHPQYGIMESSLGVITTDPLVSFGNPPNSPSIRRAKRVVAYNETLMYLEVVAWR